MQGQDRRAAPWAVAALCAAVLTGCGGGGDSGSTGGGGGGGEIPTPTSFTLGGNVSGLAAAAQLVLQSGTGQDLTVSANGAFAFASPLAAGVVYAVSVKTQPAGQTCVVGQGNGSVAAKVDNITVTCSTPLASGVPALVGDWVQRLCSRFSATSSAKSMLRLTKTGEASFSVGNGVMQYGSADCSGTGVLSPVTTLAEVQLTQTKAAADIAAHWGKQTLITGTVTYTVFSKLSETELCQLGDGNPTLFASAASVLQTVQISRDGSCYLKK